MAGAQHPTSPRNFVVITLCLLGGFALGAFRALGVGEGRGATGEKLGSMLGGVLLGVFVGLLLTRKWVPALAILVLWLGCVGFALVGS